MKMRTWLPGITPPQNATSVQHCSCAALRLAARFSTVVVGGIELSGMSTTVVMPPDAAARVPVQKPSHSVRPGSLRCTCALETHEDSVDLLNYGTWGAIRATRTRRVLEVDICRRRLSSDRRPSRR